MQFKCKNSKLSKPGLSSICPIDRTLIRYYHSRPEWSDDNKGYSAFAKLQHYWNLTIRLLSVIIRTLVAGEGGLPLCREAVGVFYCPSRLDSMRVCAYECMYI